MRILVGMSGGFDSAIAAKKLVDEGYSVEGALLLMHDYTDIEKARQVADIIGISLHVVDCRQSFDNIVCENFASEYKKGRTPNPCVICNAEVKFKCLLKFAIENGFDKIATGHYARVIEGWDGQRRIARAVDSRKDQSYMLYRLSPEIVSHLLLPLGEEIKADLREKAANDGLSGIDSPDSQEICFIPDGNYPLYIMNRTGDKFIPGPFIDENGSVVGKHKGIIHYTVGQRKGLGISLGERAFVVKIEPSNNAVHIAKAKRLSDEIHLVDTVFSVNDINEYNDSLVTVKVRYSAQDIQARLVVKAQDSIFLKLHSPMATSPGQSAVIYIGDVVLGGGIIEV